MSFSITSGKGFQLQFENGYRLSVQFGQGNYCEHRYAAEQVRDHKSLDAEIAVIGPDGEWAPRPQWGFEDDDVRGWVSADEVARIAAEVATLA